MTKIITIHFLFLTFLLIFIWSKTFRDIRSIIKTKKLRTIAKLDYAAVQYSDELPAPIGVRTAVANLLFRAPEHSGNPQALEPMEAAVVDDITKNIEIYWEKTRHCVAQSDSWGADSWGLKFLAIQSIENRHMMLRTIFPVERIESFMLWYAISVAKTPTLVQGCGVSRKKVESIHTLQWDAIRNLAMRADWQVVIHPCEITQVPIETVRLEELATGNA